MNKKIFLILLLISLACPLTNAFGQEKVTLSLPECLNIGLANNLDIKIAKIEAKIKGQDILISEAVFDALLEGELSYADDQRASASIITGTENLKANYELSATKTLPTGTELTIDYSNTRDWTNSSYVTNNPLHTTELSFTVEQPVLKNFFGYVDRRNVKLSKIEADVAGLKALNKIENSVADIEKAYWELVFAYQNRALREDLLKQAENLYSTFKEHLKIGLVETTELYETRANVRIRKTELKIAQNELKNASNELKLLLNAGGNFLILPKDALEALDKKADLIHSLNEALIENREYQMKRKALDAKMVRLKMKENSLWPEVDLVGTLAINGVDKKFEKANRRLSTDKYPYYYAGIEFSIPLENTDARGEYNKAMLEKEKAILELVQSEKEIINNIDEDVRSVNLNFENTRHWTKVREIQYLKFREEEKKIKYGRSSSKTIIDYQKDLTLATINEYNSILQYYYALIDLENAKDTLLERVGVINL